MRNRRARTRRDRDRVVRQQLTGRCTRT